MGEVHVVAYYPPQKAEDIAYLCSGRDDTRSLPCDNEWYDPLYR